MGMIHLSNQSLIDNILVHKYCYQVTAFISETESDCPDVIAKVISPKTKLATFRLSFRERAHTLKLPVGRYPYTIDNGLRLCNITLVAKGE
jgi:hypothetical protein